MTFYGYKRKDSSGNVPTMRFISIILVTAGLIVLVKSLPFVQNEDFESPNVNQVRHQGQQDMNVEASENNEVRVSFEDIQPGGNEAVESELTPLDDIEVSDEESRNKRLVSLGGNSGGASGSGGGSGNFLFDIIRLVAGSGSQSNDEQSPSGKSPEVEEAVPGPATRLLVIANKGISNLIQDLILRIAATSERFVNFKARLITSII